MQGEYRGDFTRDTFAQKKHFSRVLMQQGRVLLDADWNEQTSILLHYLQTLATDIIGPHGGPKEGSGFNLTATTPESADFNIGAGHYYVDGILCENLEKRNKDDSIIPITYKSQPYFPGDPTQDSANLTYLAYLDVWERHITYIEDNKEGDPGICEVALGGPDTCTRAQVVWQVKVADKWSDASAIVAFDEVKWRNLKGQRQPTNRGMLKAKAADAPKDNTNEPCTINPESSYRGAENQLYRVEIHKGGKAKGEAAFKWSRGNGSELFPVLKVAENNITLAHFGRDERSSLQPNDWVELVDDEITLRNQGGPLAQVKSIQHEEMSVEIVKWEVTEEVPLPTYRDDDYSSKHVVLRRWEGKRTVKENITDDATKEWIELEAGVQIQFQPAHGDAPGHEYRIGDYWLIPARVATGDIEWPRQDQPDPLPPHGVEHHYAPLAIVTVKDGKATVEATGDLRKPFSPLQLKV